MAAPHRHVVQRGNKTVEEFHGCHSVKLSMASADVSTSEVANHNSPVSLKHPIRSKEFLGKRATPLYQTFGMCMWHKPLDPQPLYSLGFPGTHSL